MLVARKVLLALLAAAALASQAGLASSSGATAGRHAALGIADENVAMFDDPRFLALGIKYVRIYVAWDALATASRHRRKVLETWLADAKARGMTPLVTFDHSGVRGRAGVLPSVARYSREFMRFRKLFPWVTEFATWNEANYFGEPTAGNPRRAARYYLALRRDCPRCTILAAELLDINNRKEAVNEVRWAREFMIYAGRQPEYWGLHNYVSANQLSAASTRALLHTVKGYVWLTETGGILRFPHYGLPDFPLSKAHQARVDNFLLNKLGRLSSRIQRIYLYQWLEPRGHTSWDSAVISPNGTPRPAYDVIANALDSWGIAPNCALSTLPPACGQTTAPASQ